MKKILIVILLPFMIVAEEIELWQAAKLSKPINDTYFLSIEGDFRSYNMGKQLKYYHGDIGVYFPLIDNFILGINIREVFELKGDSFKQEHRPHGTLSTKMNFGILGFFVRSRFEYRIMPDKDPVIRNRNMVTLKIGKGFTSLKLVPYLADEIFYDMEKNDLNRNRFFVGCEIKSISFVKATMYYMQQNDLKDEKWEPTNVVGMKFSF